jgi:hypothetical protein
VEPLEHARRVGALRELAARVFATRAYDFGCAGDAGLVRGKGLRAECVGAGARGAFGEERRVDCWRGGCRFG